MQVTNLIEDLKDGVALLNLLMEISSIHIQIPHPQPKHRYHFLNNNLCLLGFMKDHGIEAKGLGPEGFFPLLFLFF